MLALDKKWLRIGKERCLTSLRSKKKKYTDNDGGERQETSSSTSSLTNCSSDNTAEDKSVQNPNESETSAASDQPSSRGKKNTEKRSFELFIYGPVTLEMAPLFHS